MWTVRGGPSAGEELGWRQGLLVFCLLLRRTRYMLQHLVTKLAAPIYSLIQLDSTRLAPHMFVLW